MRSIIWDREKSFDRGFTKLNLNLNDTEMLLEVQDDLRTFPPLSSGDANEEE